jgi:hypothetical protein
MKKQIGCIVLAALFASSGGKAAFPAQYYAFGVGQNSCAHWTTARGEEVQTAVWIMGFWSGLNFATGAWQKADAKTGGTTDADGIIEEVRKVCKEQPSLGIGSAVFQVYVQFQSAGK